MKLTGTFLTFVGLGAVALASPANAGVSLQQKEMNANMNTALGSIKANAAQIGIALKDVEKASNASQSKDSLATIASGFQGINSALQMAIDDVSRGPSPVIAARGSSTHPDPECSVCDPLTTIVSVVLGTVADWLRGVIQVLQFAEEDAAQIVGDALKTVYLALKLTLITIQRGIFIIPVALIQLVCGLVGTIVHIILSSTGLLECVKEVGGTIIHDLIDLLGEIVHVFPLIGDFVASIIDSLHHLEN